MRMPQFLLPCLLLCAFTPVATVAAHADTLLGTTVSGTLSSGSYYNGKSIFTTNFTSPATIGPGTEFTGSLTETGYATFNISADFSATGLTVSVQSPLSYAGVVTADLLTLTFTDSAFLAPLSLQSYCNPSEIPKCSTSGYYLSSSTFSGSTLRLDFFGLLNGDVYTFVEPSALTVTPEPSSLVLALTGIAGMVGLWRQRRRRRVCCSGVSRRNRIC